VEVAQTGIIKVDTLPPATAISPLPNPGNVSYPPPLTTQLFTEDPEPGSGVSKTFYSIDSQDALEYRLDGFQALEGEHLYTYWSLDSAGNSESKKQALIKVEIPEAFIPILAGMVLLHQLLSLRKQRRGFCHQTGVTMPIVPYWDVEVTMHNVLSNRRQTRYWPAWV
jgi:hypothetical protein